MGRVRSKNTKPEMVVRRLVHSLGFRYRLHRGDLPGKPDLVFPSRRKIIFVHGCFWHRHSRACPLTRLPKSKLDFWRAKLEKNRIRDRENFRLLRKAGWAILVVWECEVGDLDEMTSRIVAFLQESSRTGR